MAMHQLHGFCRFFRQQVFSRVRGDVQNVLVLLPASRDAVCSTSQRGSYRTTSCMHDGVASHNAAFLEQEKACWSCHDHHKRGGLVCRSCNTIQPVDSSLTYFELLG